MRCRCHDSCGCSSCCRWSSPRHGLCTPPSWLSFESQSQHRPPNWTLEVVCSCHKKRHVYICNQLCLKDEVLQYAPLHFLSFLWLSAKCDASGARREGWCCCYQNAAIAVAILPESRSAPLNNLLGSVTHIANIMCSPPSRHSYEIYNVKYTLL